MNEVIRVKEVIIEKEVISCDVSPVALFINNHHKLITVHQRFISSLEYLLSQGSSKSLPII